MDFYKSDWQILDVYSQCMIYDCRDFYEEKGFFAHLKGIFVSYNLATLSIYFICFQKSVRSCHAYFDQGNLSLVLLRLLAGVCCFRPVTWLVIIVYL